MDNTGNKTNTNANPTQPIQPQGNVSISPQSIPPSPNPQQAPMQSEPPQQISPAPQENPRITLDDLYGPSGFADTNSAQVQQSTQSIPVQTVQQVQQPTSTSPQPVAQPNDFLSNPMPPSAQPISMQQSPSMSQPPMQNTVLEKPSIPDLTPPATPVESESAAVSEPQKSEAQASQIPTQAVSDMPLRKTNFQSGSTPPTVAAKEQQPDGNNEKPGGFNKLFLFRVLAGILGGVVILLLIIFGIRFFTASHPTASGNVTLTYWGLWEDANTMQGIISEFEQQHPNIHINYEKQDPKQYSQRLQTRIIQGNGPDIYTYHSSWLPVLQPDLVPLPTSVISKDDLEKNYYSTIRRDLVKNGALYGIPLEVDTLALFVNNTLFKDAKAQVPTTWDDFTTTARALTVKDANGKIKTAGAALGTYDNITHAPDILSMLFLQNGVDINTMTPANNAADALTFYTSFAQGDSAVWDGTLDPSQLSFAKGNVAMYFGYSWDIFQIKASNPDLDFSVYPVPHLPGRSITAASYWVQGVSSKSLHQEAAITFMQFLAQKNTAAALYAEETKTRIFGEPYARIDLGETLKNNALVYPFVQQAADAKSSFFAGDTYDTSLNGQMNGYLGNAVRSVLGNTSAQSAIDTLTQGVSQIEKQYGSN